MERVQRTTFNVQRVHSRLSRNPRIHAPFLAPARLGAGSESVRRGDVPSRAAARRGVSGSAFGDRGAELVHMGDFTMLGSVVEYCQAEFSRRAKPVA